MAKHRLQRRNHLTNSTGGALVAGAVGLGTLLLPAAPAAAITIPGIGTFDVPGAPTLPPPPPNPTLPPAPVPPAIDGAQDLAKADTKLGSPYVWGATGPDSFDCSGFVQWAYQQVGVSVPRTTYEQVKGGSGVDKGRLQLGDVVLFDGAEHVGLYAGDGMVVHAPSTGQPVKKVPLDSMPFYAARRY
ncbi:C40 family peptidase [Rhodococcus jostii]|uniref:C40 family peptidase n=1 Tax=Rhodococcus jostii TaxID=132919 RepID=UPI00363B5528